MTQQYAQASVVPRLVIYGPALNEVHVEQGAFEYIANYPNGQDNLKISTLMMTQATLNGTFKTLEIEGAGQVDASVSSVTNLVTNLKPASTVQVGVVRTLKVTQPDACPAQDGYESNNNLVVQGVSSGTLTYNGSERTAETIKHDCGTIIIGSEDDDES